MPIQRIGFGFKGGPHWNFLRFCDAIQHIRTLMKWKATHFIQQPCVKIPAWQALCGDLTEKRPE
jgi:hypothetical protein